MLMPAVQYGDVVDVKKRMRSIVKRLMRGENLIDVMTEGGMLDVAEHPGLLVLDGTVRGGAPHFHCGLPWMPLWQALFDLLRAPLPPAGLCALLTHARIAS